MNFLKRKQKTKREAMKCYFSSNEDSTQLWFSEKETEGICDLTILEGCNGTRICIDKRPKDGKVIDIRFY